LRNTRVRGERFMRLQIAVRVRGYREMHLHRCMQ